MYFFLQVKNQINISLYPSILSVLLFPEEFFFSSPVDADFYCPLVMIQMFPKDLYFFDI